MRRKKYFLYQKDKDHIETIKAYIVAHPDQDLRIAVLAKRFHIDKTTLQRNFRVLEKKPIHNYIVECRMERAQQLLGSGELTIHEVSQVVGFGSFSAFTNKFHKRFGYSPIEYRKKGNQ